MEGVFDDADAFFVGPNGYGGVRDLTSSVTR